MNKNLYAYTVGTLMCISSAFFIPNAQADLRDQAKRMYDRIAGVPPTDAQLTEMLNFLGSSPSANEFIEAAKRYPMANSNFYNVTLKNWATPWSTEEADVFAPLNDFTATVIGMVRDDDNFRDVLQSDVIYVGNAATGVSAYSNTSNAHYEQLENGHHDLQAVLERRTQSQLTGIPANATAGIMTTRAAAKAYFSAGTNRAMLRFTLLNFLCNDLEQFKDTTRPSDRIRQDVVRSPGGDSRIFLNSCVGCHSGMDPLAQAFAYYEWNADNQRLMYTPNQVQGKYHINSGNFKWGYHTPNDSWVNYWRKGPNALWVGWSSPQGFGYQTDANGPYAHGNGAKSLGAELANSRLFAECQAQKVFTTVCLRKPEGTDDLATIASMTNSFDTQNGSIKHLFGEAAYYCRGN